MNPKKAERKAVYWSCADEGILIHTDKDEAIEAYLEEVPDKFAGDGKLTVYGFARMETPKFDAGRMCENLIEDWAGFTNPDYPQEPTETMLAAAELFGRIFKAEFTVRSYEIVTHEDFDAGDWIILHRPDWLEGK